MDKLREGLRELLREELRDKNLKNEENEEYFTIDFNEYNFESYEKDPDTCSTTMYMCWN